MLFHFEILARQMRPHGRKSMPNFALFTRVKVTLGEGWANCLSQGFKFSLDPNIWYTFGEGPLCGLRVSIHFSRHCFVGGKFVAHLYQTRVGRNAPSLRTTWELHRRSIRLFEVYDLSLRLKAEGLKGDGRPNFALFIPHPCKFRGGMSKISKLKQSLNKAQ